MDFSEDETENNNNNNNSRLHLACRFVRAFFQKEEASIEKQASEKKVKDGPSQRRGEEKD